MANYSVQGLDKLLKRIDSMADSKPLERAVAASALKVESKAKSNITHGAASGVVYGNHQASAPGEFPASDTGALVASIHSDIAADRLSATVGSALPHGTYLELGTRAMEPRPWLKPSFDEVQPWIVRRFEKALTEIVQGGGSVHPDS